MRMRVFTLMLGMTWTGAVLGQSPPGPAPAPPAPSQRTAAEPSHSPEPAAVPGQAKPAAGAPATGARGQRVMDRMELDPTQITGNRELPKVLYIVPWKRADLGDLAGRPANSLLDEVLAPIDREVFRRQTRYYEALRPDEARNAGEAGGTAGAVAEPRPSGSPSQEPRHER